MKHSVKLNGGADLHVKVDGPRGTSVSAKPRGEMFDKVKVSRGGSIPHVDEAH
jgi:hypothetical protein